MERANETKHGSTDSSRIKSESGLVIKFRVMICGKSFEIAIKMQVPNEYNFPFFHLIFPK